VKTVIRNFVLHVSIAKPLGESGKLQLTSDMTELEFALNAFIMEGPQKGSGGLERIGSDYLVLRAMRYVINTRKKMGGSLSNVVHSLADHSFSSTMPSWPILRAPLASHH
jgi:hypothetical protein